jgi:hypothetical protein
MLSDLQRAAKKVLNSIKRAGMVDLIKWLENETDFFTAPASTMFHGNYEGGLIEHSLNVHMLACDKWKYYKLQERYPLESIQICAILHDVCKIWMYDKDEEPPTDAQLKYLAALTKGKPLALKGAMNKAYCSDLINYWKNGGDEPEYKVAWKVNDKFPLGHGEKSVYLVSQHLDLTQAEALAIRWHMTGFDAGIHFNYPSGYPFRAAMDKEPLVTIIATADMEASSILEVKK